LLARSTGSGQLRPLTSRTVLLIGSLFYIDRDVARGKWSGGNIAQRPLGFNVGLSTAIANGLW
jgi:hypothetical protein